MDGSITIGQLVAQQPSRARIFEKYNIDYCCGGNRPLATIAESIQVPLASLIAELTSHSAMPDDRDWNRASLAEVIQHILTTHHDWLKQELPRIAMLSEKVARVHGQRDARLLELAQVQSNLHEEMIAHLAKEEQILFPAAIELERTGFAKLPCHQGETGIRLDGPIHQMEAEHRLVGEWLDSIKSLCDNFVPPQGACNTWRALFDALHEQDANTRAHVHLENQVLHPRIHQLQDGRA